MLYAFFWVIPRRLNFICRRFGTLCLFHLHRHTYLPMKMEQTECSETSAYKIRTPGNYPEERIQLTKICLRRPYFDYFFEGLTVYYNLKVTSRYLCKAKLYKKKNTVKKIGITGMHCVNYSISYAVCISIP